MDGVAPEKLFVEIFLYETVTWTVTWDTKFQAQHFVSEDPHSIFGNTGEHGSS